MGEVKITFNNNINIRTQVQIFIEQELVITDVVDPGESSVLLIPSSRYDVYLKNGLTGWELARKLNSEAQTITLIQHKGRYVIK
ncbi:MAG TPA: hypothetical protein VLL52_10435 [Anaerolineae bacterium]|nr:hypothetical protein [Anaerolineae bacterium]